MTKVFKDLDAFMYAEEAVARLVSKSLYNAVNIKFLIKCQKEKNNLTHY